MDIKFVRAVTPVSSDNPFSTDRKSSTATGTVSPAAVSPVEAAMPGNAQHVMAAIALQLQDYLSSSDRDIEFRVDADTGAQVVTVRDAATGDVVRQMPTEEVLRVFKNMNAVQGTFLDEMI